MIVKTIAVGFPAYTCISEKNFQNVLMRWKCMMGHILDINPEMKLASLPEVLPPEYRDGKYLYTACARVHIPETFIMEPMRRGGVL